MWKYETLLLEDEAPVLKVILNRPDKANAVNTQMMEDLKDLCTKLRYEEKYKYVVFTGAGKFLSGGVDLKEFMSEIEKGTFTPASTRLGQLYGQELMNKLETLEQITIMAINGPCYGAGVAIALCCDFRVMTESAIICLPEAERGTFFGLGSTPRLIRAVGAQKAKEYIMLCDKISSDEACRAGLVCRVAKDGELMETVSELVGKMERSPFFPLRHTKKIVNAMTTPALGNIHTFEPELMELASGGFSAGIAEFMQKRNEKK